MNPKGHGNGIIEDFPIEDDDQPSDRLIGPSHPIAAIADEMGFCDQAALSRHFKQVVGPSPAAHRE